MKKSILFLCSFSFLGNILCAQNLNIAERLGYSKDAKLLIIHGDDLGVANSQNRASIKALENSPVNSASIMVPCPWFPEIAAYARKNQNVDFGLHLTLNSEWDFYKWGPVSSKDSVPGLVNKDGYFFSSVDSLQMQGTAQEVEIELRNQVKKAYKAGINVTHLDGHMGAAMSRPDYLEAYMRIGKEYGLPVLMDKRVYDIPNDAIQKLLGPNTVLADKILSASPATFDAGMEEFYTNVLTTLEPGLNFLILHLAYDDDEMKAVTVNHPYWGAKWRQADFDFFTSEKCGALIKKQGIVLVTWKELRDKIVRADK
ncbi:hypothetical protein GGR42_000321 [Saonia flava]|uniref:ChbG/HpnK family deacetylase n=1 Tax=Saonia flava TaxID=523696 RepID=A0A846QZ27_9FLAO|nr:polysaccharide deacetylase family protein [Saonia flava]NJB69859.1 hypothetical protein [Saonia flava]